MSEWEEFRLGVVLFLITVVSLTFGIPVIGYVVQQFVKGLLEPWWRYWLG